MLYKLTKGSLSRIRSTKEACKELEKEGYKLIGEVDEDFKPIVKKTKKAK